MSDVKFNMKLLIIVGLLSSAYCSDNDDQNGFENKERRVADGSTSNYEGTGLTKYDTGPFLVKGKLKSDITNDERNNKEGGPKNDDDNNQSKYIGNVGYCLGEYRDKDGSNYKNNFNNQNPADSSLIYDDDVDSRCDRMFRYTGPTANDEPGNLIRPCALDDWQCIRKYFAANSNCKPAYGPIPDPLYIDIVTIFYPIANMTVAFPNLMTRGLSNAKISEFYVNRRSSNLVLALDVTNLNLTIQRAYFRYRRTAKESIVLADYATVNYRALTLTAVIPNVPHLRLDLADIHADIQDIIPPFFIGPAAFNSTDPDVISAAIAYNSALPVVIREEFTFLSQLLTSIYIQENICDFGLKFISV